jgi:hypothetical protein
MISEFPPCPEPVPQRAHWPSSLTATAGIMLVTAGLCIAVVAWQVFGSAPFLWASKLPRSWQGGIEAGVVVALLACMARIEAAGMRMFVGGLIAFLYLRRHAVDAALLVDAFYLESVIALGYVVRRRLGMPVAATQLDYLGCLVLGLACWSTLAWGASLAGFGGVHALRWLSLVLAVVAFAQRPTPWFVFAHRRFTQFGRHERMLVAALAGWLLVLLARTNVAFGYDSFWYGLRGERVLVATGSAFDALGLVSPVFYYPKLYELFLVPVSALGDTSVITGVTVGLFGFALLACNELLRELGVRERAARLACVGGCATLPAIANVAIMAKPDLPAALLLLVGAVYGIRHATNRSPSAALWMLACLTLATQIKLTAIPYAGVLVVCVAAARWLARTTDPADPWTGPRAREAIAVATFAVATTALITWRTWVLTGVPTIGPDPLLHVWRWFGLVPHPPAGTLNWTRPQHWSDVPALVLDILFRPQHLPHVVISWVGNVWLWLIAMAVLLRRAPLPSRIPSAAFIAATGLALTGLVLMLGLRYNVRGADGNYFIAAVVPAVLLGFAALWHTLEARPPLRRTLLAALAAFCLFQAAYAFVSAGWAPGTRRLDLDFGRSPRDRSQQDAHAFASGGLARIATYLKAVPGTPHVVGCVHGVTGLRLSATYEDLWSIGDSRPEYVGTPAGFLKFLDTQHVRFLVMPNAGPRVTSGPKPAIIEVMSDPSRFGLTRLIVDRKYTLYRWDPPEPAPATATR